MTRETARAVCSHRFVMVKGLDHSGLLKRLVVLGVALTCPFNKRRAL